ncbi:MAG: hypothetical protein R6U89_00420, partial [Dehalococcoidia bacterium]
TGEDGKVDTGESDKLREEMRERRRQRSVDAGEWWKQERQVVLEKSWPEDMYNMFADSCKYGKFQRQFYGMWQLPEDYSL